ncbi:MAG: TRAP transporter large permease [Hyphomicrobiales bacterium]
MTGAEAAIAGLAALVALLAVGLPVGLAMLLVGTVGTSLYTGTTAIVLASLKTLTFDTFSSYGLSVVPLFLLMGQFAARSDLSERLFRAANAVVGDRRGGVAMAAIGACAGFGAVCGSSLATAATMSRVALPEMRRLGCPSPLAAGSLAAGGTLGILIPPSVVLVVYAILAEENIATLFIAAILPGLLAVAFYLAAVAITARLAPAGTGRPAAMAGERLTAILSAWPVATIFLVMVGGIVAGIFTPTEGASIGTLGTLVFALARGMDRKALIEGIVETAISTAMIFFVVLGAASLNTFLALTRMPELAAGWIAASGLSPWAVLAIVLAFYIVLGCLMESLSMILLTVPIVLPVILGLDFGLAPGETAVWFGVLVLVVVEVGLITPPVGLNLFVIRSLSPEMPLTTIYRGVAPFLAADLVRIALLAAFPAISLWLVRLG